ncbi:hypothetical protein [Planosporangium mesophilum]|uniref:Uncharacterized protein n=1 Tax=Planosporangium mesophilum TaxID=689768 RepID=A0A8J3TDZ6_9ACTN|nr:hypothetical protein [Planosporangium mesophilum]NJC85570.1 hypothetical protein [Planosporangium mesophilum]GII24564.1 hypothetical protein Pme01_41610 [Planosporangium mesophilum]
MSWLDPASVPDAGAYLARLVRLDAAALVRLRPAGAGALALWARLPFEVLVTRQVAADLAGDVTVRAADLLRAFDADSAELPVRYDSQWLWPLPPGAGRVVERLPVAEVHRIGAAAATTLREAAAEGVRGRAVGERALREALLDHVPVVVTADDGSRVEVPQRLVQAVVRMGFLGPDPAVGDVRVRTAGGWVGLAGEYGTGWYRPSRGLQVRRTDERSVTSS